MFVLFPTSYSSGQLQEGLGPAEVKILHIRDVPVISQYARGARYLVLVRAGARAAGEER